MVKNSGKNEIISYTDEKQIYPKVDFVNEVSIICMNDQSLPELKVNSKNLSKSGLLFGNREPIELGTKLQLKVNIDNTLKSIIVTGIVVRTEAHEDGMYDIGVLFYNMEKDTKNEISKYIIRQLNQN